MQLGTHYLFYLLEYFHLYITDYFANSIQISKGIKRFRPYGTEGSGTKVSGFILGLYSLHFFKAKIDFGV